MNLGRWKHCLTRERRGMKGRIKASHRQRDSERARRGHTVPGKGIDDGAQRNHREGPLEIEGDGQV